MTRSIRWSIPMRILGAPLAILILVAISAPSWSDPITPADSERYIAQIVASNLGREHLTRHPVDDEVSQRTMKLFLEMLDPMKVYFYQADIDDFMRDENNLDDMVKKGDLSFPFKVFRVFLQRIDERIKLVDEMVRVDHDFTVDEQMVRDKDAAQYSQSEAEARERWRQRIKFDFLTMRADKEDEKSQKDPVTRISNRYHSFANRMHQTDSEELLEMFMTAMSMAFDPHTSYMSPKTLKNFDIQMSLKLEGIGAALRSDDEYTKVDRIIPGGPADKDGRLKPKDRVTGVGEGRGGEIVDVVGMKLSDVVDKIRGKEGTVVRLQVTSDASPEPRIIELTRAMVELKDSEAQQAIFEQGHKPDGQPYRIGVIELPSFYMDMEAARRGYSDFKSTTRDVKLILEDFNRKGVDAVVLDLRLNGGGSLQEAINLTGLFIGEGPVVQVKGPDARVTPYNDSDSEMVWKGPLVVLISKYSASASEILAGAIQDYRRGIIVGDRSTHGKGTVQSVMDLGQRFFAIPNAPTLGSLKITIQQFYRPSGDSTQKRGVEADVELPSLSTVYEGISEADLDYPVEFGSVRPLAFQKYNLVDPAALDRLRYLSRQRIEVSPDFQKDRKDISFYLRQKESKHITLNEQKFMDEIKELDTSKREKELLEKLSGAGNTGIQRNYYLDEALSITADYLQQAMFAQVR